MVQKLREKINKEHLSVAAFDKKTTIVYNGFFNKEILTVFKKSF